MRNLYVYPVLFPFIFTVALLASCSGQSNTGAAPAQQDTPIDEYVVEIFEDKAGNLWFGTLSKGVARYDGKSLVYFTLADGLVGNAVVSIAQAADGTLWFGTQSGLSRYDGRTFTNFTTREGLIDDRVSQVMVDKTGTLWVGTWGGVSRYDGARFSDFPLPVPEVELLPYQNTMDWVTTITEDAQGAIWFGRDGYGACRYDGAGFTHFTKKDGLASNNVQAIVPDRQGRVWFGCRFVERDHPDPEKRFGPGGLIRYDGATMTAFPEWEGLHHTDVYAIHEDRQGNIWISAGGFGLYRYDGTSFHLYQGTNRMDLTARFGLQAIRKDRKGTLWLGFSGGLFRLDGTSIVHVPQQGPWE